jgi:hypothetical protein
MAQPKMWYSEIPRAVLEVQQFLLEYNSCPRYKNGTVFFFYYE